MKTAIYLDYNATAPLRPEAMAAMRACLDMPLNASAVHAMGREGRRLVDQARAQVAALVGAPVNQVIFNSGATEGNNTVLKYFANERVLVSAIEHPSVLQALPNAEIIPVTKQGVLDLNALEEMLKRQTRTALVSVMMVNNETGIIQPIREISELAHRHGALFHSDAVQAAGRTALNLDTVQIDFLTLSAHKLGGPQGIGALVLGLCGVTPVMMDGGGQEKSARAGTENIAGIAGFGAAALAAQSDMASYQQRLSDMQHRLERGILEISPGAIIYGRDQARVCNTTLFALEGASSETLLMAFDLDGVALSNGSACSSGRVQISHVLKAMGQSDALAGGALRVSTGWHSSPADIDAFLELWSKIHQRLQDKIKRSTHA
jgi:cysteine desulfurase